MESGPNENDGDSYSQTTRVNSDKLRLWTKAAARTTNSNDTFDESRVDDGHGLFATDQGCPSYSSWST
jgi:hypothetical protein